jgi:hypothetical protein
LGYGFGLRALQAQKRPGKFFNLDLIEHDVLAKPVGKGFGAG